MDDDTWKNDVLLNFHSQILPQLSSRLRDEPGAVIHVISDIQNILDGLHNSAHIAVNSVSEPSPEKVKNGLKKSYSDTKSAGKAAKGKAIGRNLESRLRELVVLEYLNISNHPLALNQIEDELTEKGFGTTQSTVVSQLHRLVNSEVIIRPGNGMYMITEEGRYHLNQLRSSHGNLLKQILDGLGEED